MQNVFVGILIVLILGGAIFFILREKKKGTKCVGCPNSHGCSGHCENCQEM